MSIEVLIKRGREKVPFKGKVLMQMKLKQQNNIFENSCDLDRRVIKREPLEMKSIDISLSRDPDPLKSSLGFAVQTRELLREI